MNDGIRDEKGRFLPGVSGCPGGRAKTTVELRRLCRELTPEILERLRALMMGADADSVSVQAAKLILAYGHGLPQAKVIIDDNPEEGEPLSLDELRALARAPIPSVDDADDDEPN